MNDPTFTKILDMIMNWITGKAPPDQGLSGIIDAVFAFGRNLIQSFQQQLTDSPKKDD